MLNSELTCDDELDRAYAYAYAELLRKAELYGENFSESEQEYESN